MFHKDNIIHVKFFPLSLKRLPAFLGIIKLDYMTCHFHKPESNNSNLRRNVILHCDKSIKWQLGT